ncbi:GntR family transcriptional regulator [Listeria booriae]|uniref:GntR family transcriptional regulator n=1 Tax=Listeria booriae TaxID=1552123 RepID=UPI001623ABD9|nr:GntR family transcriptional regulator [Listeria booriae]MBC1292508.1 GntR family transcriptional regulator [Listeria booriae]
MYTVNSQSHVPIYEQIVAQIRDYCMLGLLEPGDELPSVREMSTNMLVNPNIVRKAYEELARLGVIEIKQSEGAVVTPLEKHELSEAHTSFRQSLEQLILNAKELRIEEQQLQSWVREHYLRLEE